MNRRKYSMLCFVALFAVFMWALSPHHRAGADNAEARIQADGTIDNASFGIVAGEDVDAETALQNKQNLQLALEYAAANGESLGLLNDAGQVEVKLEQAVYVVDGQHKQVFLASDQSIEVPSGISLNLNGSVLRQIAGREQGYAIFMIYGTENIRIYGGTLIGDKDLHDYVDDTSHEWGFGIDIRGGKNILLENLEIYNMTGDSIIMGGKDTYLSSGGILPEDITISDCRLHDNRRQGISVMGVENLLIEGCEIYNIGIDNGTPPGYGIDLENELDWPVKKTVIRENNFYNNKAGAVLVQREASETLIERNTIDGKIGMVYGNHTTITQNKFKNGGVSSLDTSEPKYTVIDSNEFENGGVHFAINTGVVVSNNTFDGGRVQLDFSSGAVYANTFINGNPGGEAAVKIGASGLLSQEMEFLVYVYGNSIDGSYSGEYQADAGDKLTVITQKDPTESYIRNFREDLSISENLVQMSYINWDSPKGRMISILLGGAAVVLVMMAAILFFVIRRRRRRQKKTE